MRINSKEKTKSCNMELSMAQQSALHALGITTYFKKLYRTYLKKEKDRTEIENFFGFPQKR